MFPAELYDLQRMIGDFAEVVACAVVKQQCPMDDLVSKRTLYEKFGREWVDRNIAPRGKIEGRRMGPARNSPIKFSLTEVMTHYRTEKMLEVRIKGKYGIK